MNWTLYKWGGGFQMNYKENWCVSYQSAACRICLGDNHYGYQGSWQTVIIHPCPFFHTIVFSYKKILKEYQTTSSPVLCLLFMNRSLLFLSLLFPCLPTCLHPYPLSRGSSASHLLCDVICWAPFTLRDPWMRAGKHPVRCSHLQLWEMSWFMVPVL